MTMPVGNGTSYNVALSCCQMGWDQIYKALLSKLVFFGAFMVFELGALVSALAPNSASIIIGLAISGAGISGSFVSAVIIVSYIVPLRWRPSMTAFFSVLIGSTQTAGPVIGGVLTSRLFWRWCVWINLPLGGGLSLLLAFLGGSIKEPKSKRGGKTNDQLLREFDILGFAAWVPAVVCLTLILQFGGIPYAWNSGELISIYAITAVLFVTFIALQARAGEKALAPARIIKQRSLACSALYILFIQAAKSQLSYFELPIFFQAAQDNSALESGVNTIPGFLTYFISQILTGIIISWLGLYTPFMLAGSSLAVAGTSLLTTLTVSTGSSHWIGYKVLAMAGFGLSYNGPTIAAQTVFRDPRDTSKALTIITTLQDLGASLGVSIGTTILEIVVRRELVLVIPSITTAQISNEGITGLETPIDPSNKHLVAEAYAYAVRKVFTGSVSLTAATLVLALFVEWRSVKGKDVNGKRKAPDVESKE